MSDVIAATEMLAAAAADVAGIGSSLNAANPAAAIPTTAVVAAAGDEVPAPITSLVFGRAQQFQALSAQAAGFDAQFVPALNAAEGAYVAAEAPNGAPLQSLEQELHSLGVFSPVKLLTGRPRAGNGADEAAGTGDAGGDGGWLFGTGGTGGAGYSPTTTDTDGRAMAGS